MKSEEGSLSVRSGSHSEMSPLPLEEARPKVRTDVQLVEEEEEDEEDGAVEAEVAAGESELVAADLTFSSDALSEEREPLLFSRLCESTAAAAGLLSALDAEELVVALDDLTGVEELSFVVEVLAGEAGGEEDEEDFCDSVDVVELEDCSLMAA